MYNELFDVSSKKRQMENVSVQVYEQIKAQILEEIASRKETSAEARAVFAGARAYIPELEDKYGSGYDERLQLVSHNVYLLFEAVKKAALSAYGCLNPREACKAGRSGECGRLAEKILEVLLK